MAQIRGPKGTDPTKQGGRVLPLRVPARTEPGDNKAETSQPTKAAVFDPNASHEVEFPDSSSGGSQGAPLKARLTAMGVKGADSLPIKGRGVVRITETPIGKILDGSVVIERPEGLGRLVGVVRVTGDVTLQEGKFLGGEVTAVMSLMEIGGRLTIEGVS